MTSYLTSIETVSLSRTVFELFDFKVFRVWPWPLTSKGHLGSKKFIPFESPYMTSFLTSMDNISLSLNPEKSEAILRGTHPRNKSLDNITQVNCSPIPISGNITGADPEGGHRGHVPPLWKKCGHTICPEPMSFLEGVGVGGGVTWSLEKVKTKISKLYIVRIKKIITT